MLVLDESGSIGSTTGATAAVKARDEGLPGRPLGDRLRRSRSSTSARRPLGRSDYTTVTAESIVDGGVFDNYLDNGYKPNGWTNWEAAFQKVGEANGGPTLADLVVFMTDGDPTARQRPAERPHHGPHRGRRGGAATCADRGRQGQDPEIPRLRAGCRRAVCQQREERAAADGGFRIRQIPRPGPISARPTTRSRRTSTKLAAALRQIALELCRSLGDRHEAGGRGRTASTSLIPGGSSQARSPPTKVTTPGCSRSLRPTTGPTTETTNEKGVATFQWDTTNPDAQSTFSVSELVQDGYDFVDANCVVTPGRPGKRTPHPPRSVHNSRAAN